MVRAAPEILVRPSRMMSGQSAAVPPREKGKLRPATPEERAGVVVVQRKKARGPKANVRSKKQLQPSPPSTQHILCSPVLPWPSVSTSDGPIVSGHCLEATTLKSQATVKVSAKNVSPTVLLHFGYCRRMTVVSLLLLYIQIIH
eukprot:GHVS01048507.1.p2 GENE.GHVS01048507.1~~GHVS01048507.1.p2  ORF type:complete len:144 (-),score=24.88 GHVS01048507.1:1325-1756(-)